MKIRLLQTGSKTAYENMSLDEAILQHVQQKMSSPTLRLYSWQPRAISIGYFQSLHEEVVLEKCYELGIDFIRRITGGGAVFHDAEVTYSLIAPLDGSFIPHDIQESYQKICSGIIAGLALIGIRANFVPLNDIVVGQQKISGNAQTRKQSVLLQHGTILLAVDVETMFSLLKIPDEKIKDKAIKDVKERVTSIQALLKKPVSPTDVEQALIHGFQHALQLEYSCEKLSESEITLAQQLAKNKYQTEQWNKKR